MGCCNKRPVPGLKKQIANLALTAANVIAHAGKTGQVMADKDLIGKRIAQCQGCSQLNNGRCSACGCFIQIKAGLKAAQCPLKKW